MDIASRAKNHLFGDSLCGLINDCEVFGDCLPD